MRVKWTEVMAVLGIFAMVSCGGTGGSHEMGNLPAGPEPAEGGIAEVPNPSPAMAKKAGKSLSQIQRGHEVYMLKCGECHNYKLPQNLDVDEWQEAVPKMIKHAGLERTDEKAVLDYVVAVKIQQGG